MKMNALMLFPIWAVLIVSFVKCEEIFNGAPCYIETDGEQACLADGTGYAPFKCTNEKWRQEEKIKCEKPNTGCRCYRDPQYANECECVNPTKRPKWPSLGVIRWNEVVYHDISWRGNRQRTANLPGEVHKNGNGHYMKKWTKESSVPKTEFEIIIPSSNRKSFIKYTGSGNSKKCSKSNVNEEGSLYSLWWKPKYVLPYVLHWEIKKTPTISEQMWSTYDNNGDMVRWNWTWTMDYNSEKDIAIPIRYLYSVPIMFGFDGIWDDEEFGVFDEKSWDYTFEELKEEDESFRLEDYCSNI